MDLNQLPEECLYAIGHSIGSHNTMQYKQSSYRTHDYVSINKHIETITLSNSIHYVQPHIIIVKKRNTTSSPTMSDQVQSHTRESILSK